MNKTSQQEQEAELWVMIKEAEKTQEVPQESGKEWVDRATERSVESSVEWPKSTRDLSRILYSGL